MGAAPCLYVVFFYNLWQLNAGAKVQTYEVILCTSFLIALLEALRRVLGISLTFVMLFFILHPMLCDYLPGLLTCKGYSYSRVMEQFFRPASGIFGAEVEIASTVVIRLPAVRPSARLFGSRRHTDGHHALGRGPVQRRNSQGSVRLERPLRNGFGQSFCECCHHRHVHRADDEIGRLPGRNSQGR